MHQQICAAQEHHAWILGECAKLFEDGRLKIHVSHALPLAEAVEVHQLIEAGGMMGKVVLLMD
jgi:NADPH2:quinone reductase